MSAPLQLECRIAGNGPPLFLIHAFPLDSGMWEGQIRELRAHFSLYAPDLPGFGASKASPGWRIDSVAKALLSLADRHGILQFGVIGLSMGTYAAFEMYRQAPGRVSRLVLADGRARADSDSERDARTRLISELEARGIAALDERVLPRLLGDDSDPDLRERIRTAARAATVRALTHALVALRERHDSTDLLDVIRCPTLVVVGDRDAITAPEECREMANRIATAQYVEIPNAGHLSNLENPRAFNQTLQEFLKGC